MATTSTTVASCHQLQRRGLDTGGLRAAAAVVVANLSRLLHRTIVLLVISLSLRQHAALGASRMLSEMRLTPAAVTVQAKRLVCNDQSAVVRLHRSGRSIDCWLVTPHSRYWNALGAATAPCPLEQATQLQWPPTDRGACQTSTRLERVSPVAAFQRLAPRMPIGHSVPPFGKL